MDFEDILRKTDIEKLYLSYLADRGRTGDELHTNCPFHDDNKESFSVNLKTGLWKCFTASCPQHAGGNLIQFYAATENISEAQALQHFKGDSKPDPEPINYDLIARHHSILLDTPATIKFLQEECGYTLDTIERFKLGWDGERVWIPIIEGNRIVNIRKYAPGATAQAKVRGIVNRNEMRLWPLEALEQDEVYLFEGEKDCMLASQLGINAMTVTSGAGSFKRDWVPLFKDKSVRICYDIDPAGVEGAKRVAEFIGRITKEVKIILLPLKKPANADFTDYIVSSKKTIDDFSTLVSNVEPLVLKEPSKVTIEDKVHKVSLDMAAHSQYFFKRVKSCVIIAGKDLAPYLVPKRIRVRCAMGKKTCVFCGIGACGGDVERTFDYLSPDTLKLINCSDSQQEVAIKETLSIAGTCKQFTYEIIEAQNIEEIKLIPELDYSSDSKEYVVRTAYYAGHGIKSNQIYDIEAITMPHPQTQYATHLIYKMSEAKSGIEQFRMTEEMRKQLEVFQCQ